MVTSNRNTQARPYQHLYGPVPSRRLGRSLGIDLVLPKTCTEACVFCQIGRTSRLTIERAEYVPAHEVIDEFRHWCDRGGEADVVTMAGAGEPTLHARFGEILAAVRDACDIPTVLLSNGTLFWRRDVRADACRAHVVKVSVSAWDQESFQRINRPHPELRFDRIMDGIREFRRTFDGRMWVEVMVLAGLNDALDAMQRIRTLVEPLRPEHVHLNTSVRPPAESWARPVDREQLARCAKVFGDAGTVIADAPRGSGEKITSARPAAVDILHVLSRRACTIEDLSAGLNLPRETVAGEVEQLRDEGSIRAEQRGDKTFYLAVMASDA